MKILVTGGAGFIGANFVHCVYEHRPDWQITVLDALTYAGNLANLEGLNESRFSFVKGDICDAAIVDATVKDCEAVVHFAAESHVDNSLSGPKLFIETNILGTYQLLEACRKYNKRFHHISTDEVFGDLALDSADQFDEQTAYDPSSPYAASKAGSDHLVRAWVRSFGLQATITNCANNYGPYQHVEKLIPRQITEILENRRPKLYGQGVNVREWTHVDDHNDGVLKVLENGRIGETYLIGSGVECNNKQIIETLLAIMGKHKNGYELVSDRPGHDLRYSNNSNKLRSELGWQPRYENLTDGLKATVQWYQNNQAWWKPQKQVTEAKYKELGR